MPRFLALLALVPLLLSPLACEDPGRRQTGEAGVVVRLVGSASARRLEAGGAPRPLTRGSTLYPDDAITPRGDSVIWIRIFESGERIRLAGAEERRLGEIGASDSRRR